MTKPQSVRFLRKPADLTLFPENSARAYERKDGLPPLSLPAGKTTLRAREQVSQDLSSAGLLLTPEQRRFLCFFLAGDLSRIRAVWLEAGGRAVGAAVDVTAPPPTAIRVKAYRLCDGRSFKGALDAYRILDLHQLGALAGFWAEPFRTLNADGEALARALEAAAAEPAVTETFKVPDRASPEAFKWAPVHAAWLDAQARAEGRPKTAIILQALAEYRIRHEGHT